MGQPRLPRFEKRETWGTLRPLLRRLKIQHKTHNWRAFLARRSRAFCRPYGTCSNLWGGTQDLRPGLCYVGPSGACPFPTFTHGLRRGLHSGAAARLGNEQSTPPRRWILSSHAHTAGLVFTHGLRRGLHSGRSAARNEQSTPPRRWILSSDAHTAGLALEGAVPLSLTSGQFSHRLLRPGANYVAPSWLGLLWAEWAGSRMTKRSQTVRLDTPGSPDSRGRLSPREHRSFRAAVCKAARKSNCVLAIHGKFTLL